MERVFKPGDTVSLAITGSTYQAYYSAKATVISTAGDNIAIEWIRDLQNGELVNGQPDGIYPLNHFEFAN